MSRRCASCDRPLHKGKSRRAWALGRSGELAQGCVCKRCVLRAVVVVPPAATTVSPLCACCKQGVASVCAGCHGRSQKNVVELVRANVRMHIELARRSVRDVSPDMWDSPGLGPIVPAPDLTPPWRMPMPEGGYCICTPTIPECGCPLHDPDERES